MVLRWKMKKQSPINVESYGEYKRRKRIIKIKKTAKKFGSKAWSVTQSFAKELSKPPKKRKGKRNNYKQPALNLDRMFRM